MTVSAPVRLSPVPPALRLMKKRGMPASFWKRFDLGLALGGLAVEVAEAEFAARGLVAQQVEDANELAEEEDAMAAVDGFVDQLEGAVHFGGGFFPAASLGGGRRCP